MEELFIGVELLDVKREDSVVSQAEGAGRRAVFAVACR